MFELKVSGMTCPSCASSLKHTLHSKDPQAEVAVDIKNQTVKVKSTEDEKTIRSLIEEAGFPVISIRRVG